MELTGEVLLEQRMVDVEVYDEIAGGLTNLRVAGVELDGHYYPSRESLLGALIVGEQLTYPGANLGPLDIGFPCGLAIRTELRLVTIGDEEAPNHLTKKEFSVLEVIARQPRRVHPGMDILGTVWGENYCDDPKSSHVVEVHLANIRRKLDAVTASKRTPAGPNAGLITTSYANGFRIGDRAFSPEPLQMPRRLVKQAS